MKNTALLALAASLLPVAALANPPLFAAECAGGVNRGGYNIDTDDRGHIWINGHRVNAHAISAQAWEGGYHGYVFLITTAADGSDLQVSWTGPNRANGICTIVAQ